MKKLLTGLFLLVAVSLASVYVFRNWDLIVSIQDISLKIVLSMVFLVILTTFENGLINYILYRSLGVHLSLLRGYGLAIINTLANQLPFTGGVIAKGVYLKRRHGMTYGRFLSATVAVFVFFVV